MDLTRNQKLAAIAILGIAIIGLGISFAKPSLNNGEDIKITEPEKSASDKVDITVDDQPGKDFSAGSGASVIVHVAGRVKFPNVYRLVPGSRAIDAVKAAGGALPDASLESINLAAKVKDGEQIYIPSRNNLRPQFSAPAAQSGYTGSAGRPSASGASSPSGKLKSPGMGYININTAGSEELQRLPGVGPSTAEKIIDYRTQIGRFSSVDQILDVKGIGPKKMEQMRPYIVL